MRKSLYGLFYSAVQLHFTIDHEEKEAMFEAIYNAYESLDEIVRDYNIYTQDFQYQISFFRVKEFITEFAKHGTHHFFTLNQDLLLERKFYNEASYHNIELTIPGIDNYLWFNTSFNDLKPNFSTILPDVKQLEKNKETYSLTEGYHYIKLHGSQNWKPSTGKKGMVIGSEKEAQIRKEPLLKWYFDIFEEVLYQSNNKLLIIGYSFSDEHVNRVIKEAIEKNNLKVYILMPRSPEKIIQDLTKKPHGKEIIKGICGFFPYKLSDIFPTGNKKTKVKKRIQGYLFS